MKKVSLILLMSALSLSALTSCQETETQPDITIHSDGNIVLPASGGISEIQYSISNPVSDGTLSSECNSDWVNCTIDTEKGLLILNAQTNILKETRSSILSLTYTYGNSNIKREYSIIQNKATFDVYFEAQYFSGDFYGTYFTADANNYFITLSDKSLDSPEFFVPGGTYYQFNIYAEAPNDMETLALQEGVYSVGEPGATAIGTISPDMSCVMTITDDEEYIGPYMFVKGTMTVTKDSDGNYKYIAEVSDDNDVAYYMVFNGNVGTFNDFSPKDYQSTLEGDYDADLSNITEGYAMYFGDFYDNGTDNWIIRLEPDNGLGSGDGFQIELNTVQGSFEGGIPTGVYSGDSFHGSETFYSGFAEDFAMHGTWFYHLDDGMLDNPQSPLISGEIKVSNKGNGQYDFEIECTDDSGNDYIVSCKWSGTLVCEDNTYNPESNLNRVTTAR